MSLNILILQLSFPVQSVQGLLQTRSCSVRVEARGTSLRSRVWSEYSGLRKGKVRPWSCLLWSLRALYSGGCCALNHPPLSSHSLVFCEMELWHKNRQFSFSGHILNFSANVNQSTELIILSSTVVCRHATQ